MNKAIRLGMTTLLALLGIMFVFNGLNWYINPAAAAEGLGMPLLQGGGLSTQLGDMSSFFLVLGLFVLAGVVTKNRQWFYAPVALLGLAAIGRTLAWAVHDASLTLPLIIMELVMAALLWFLSKPVCNEA